MPKQSLHVFLHLCHLLWHPRISQLHPEIRPQIKVMKTEVMKYQSLAVSIKSFEERKDTKGKDTFDLSDRWKSNCETLPAFAYVLCAVITNSPNSCPPESLFSILIAINDNHTHTHTHVQYARRDHRRRNRMFRRLAGALESVFVLL